VSKYFSQFFGFPWSNVNYPKITRIMYSGVLIT